MSKQIAIRASRKASRNRYNSRNVSASTASALVMALAGHIDERGEIAVTVTMKFHPVELVTLARWAKHKGLTIDGALTAILQSSRGGLLECIDVLEAEEARR